MFAIDSRVLRCWFAALALACQRLPSDEPVDPPSSATGQTPGNEGGTYITTGSQAETDGESGGPQRSCDPTDPQDCARGGRCTVISTVAGLRYRCVPDVPFLDPLDNCTPDRQTGLDGCPAASACIDGPQGPGLCLPLCFGPRDCGIDACLVSPGDLIPHCAPRCTPFAASCPTPLECRRTQGGFVCQFAARSDVGVAGDACSPLGDLGCGPGFTCISGALVPGCTDGNCCAPLCDFDAASPCQVPTMCTGIFTRPEPGFERIGACFVPA